MPNDRENILSALCEKPLKVYEIMKRANLPNEEACQSLLLKMRSEGDPQANPRVSAREGRRTCPRQLQRRWSNDAHRSSWC